MNQATHEAPAPGRKRDASRDDALCQAALEALAEVGYDRLTIDAVAARAGGPAPGRGLGTHGGPAHHPTPRRRVAAHPGPGPESAPDPGPQPEPERPRAPDKDPRVMTQSPPQTRDPRRWRALALIALP